MVVKLFSWLNNNLMYTSWDNECTYKIHYLFYLQSYFTEIKNKNIFNIFHHIFNIKPDYQTATYL